MNINGSLGVSSGPPPVATKFFLQFSGEKEKDEWFWSLDHVIKFLGKREQDRKNKVKFFYFFFC